MATFRILFLNSQFLTCYITILYTWAGITSSKPPVRRAFLQWRIAEKLPCDFCSPNLRGGGKHFLTCPTGYQAVQGSSYACKYGK